MKNLKSKRIESGLSQAALADKLGLNQSTIAFWETGAKDPTANKLPKIAKLLGCSIDELFSAEEKEAG